MPCPECGGGRMIFANCPNPDCESNEVEGTGCCVCEHTGRVAYPCPTCCPIAHAFD